MNFLISFMIQRKYTLSTLHIFQTNFVLLHLLHFFLLHIIVSIISSPILPSIDSILQ